MAVLIETLDISRMSEGGRPVSELLATIPVGARNVSVTFGTPTGEKPICVVNCYLNKKHQIQADIYAMKENRYLPVYVSDEVVQVLVSDENGDDFEQQRIATLDPQNRSFPLEIRRNGEKTGRWVNFFLED